MTVLQKKIPAALLEHYQGEAVTTTLLMRIRTKTGQLYGFTDLDVDLTYDPAAVDPYNTGDDWGPADHKALNGGFEMSRLEAAANLSVDNADLTILPGDDSVTPQQMVAGFLDSADVRIYRVNYMDLSMGHEVYAVGKLGQTKVSENYGTLEYRSLADLLRQPVADLYTVTCRHKFGGPKCPKAFTWTEFEVTAVDGDEPHLIFGTDISPADDFYVRGVVEWLTGNNAGSQMDIDQNTGGTFATMLAMGYAAQIGDTGRVRQDCSKVWGDAQMGCLYHWGEDRFQYFGGYPHARVGDRSMVPGAIINEG